jgi:hypothetical protein
MGAYSLGMPHFSARVVKGDHSPAQLGCSFEWLELDSQLPFSSFYVLL